MTETDVTTQEDWDPGKRQDLARPRTDRRRIGWREFRRSYPGLITTRGEASVDRSLASVCEAGDCSPAAPELEARR